MTTKLQTYVRCLKLLYFQATKIDVHQQHLALKTISWKPLNLKAEKNALALSKFLALGWKEEAVPAVKRIKISSMPKRQTAG